MILLNQWHENNGVLKQPRLSSSCIKLDTHVCPAQGQRIPQNDRFAPEKMRTNDIEAHSMLT